MAVSARVLLAFLNGKKFLKTETEEALYKSLSVTADGNDNGLTITENAGHFGFSGKNLTNVGTVDGRDVSVDGTALDGHLDGGTGKHDATEVDYERTDGSKKDIQAGSDAVESALTDLDDAKISKTGSIAFTADQSLGGNKITNLGAPTSANDAARKVDVDNASAGLDQKASVRAATTAALPAATYANGTAGVGATLTADANGALAAQDGVTLVANDDLLVKNQAAGLQNGLYTVTQVGDGSNPFILTRRTDADENSQVTANLFTFIEEGTENGDTGWSLITNDPITVGTTALVFTQFTGASALVARDGLLKTGNTLDLELDESTLEIAGGVGSGGVGRIKDAGVTLAKLASDSVDENKIKSTALGSELTGGSGAVLNVERSITAQNSTGSSIAAGKLVYVKNVAGAAKIELADADTAGAGDYQLGVTLETIADTASGAVAVRAGTKVTPSGGGAFVPGKKVYVSGTAGDGTQTLPTAGTGVNVYVLGRAESATLVRLEQEHEGEYV